MGYQPQDREKSCTVVDIKTFRLCYNKSLTISIQVIVLLGRFDPIMKRVLTVNILLPILRCEVLQGFSQCLVRLEWKLEFYLGEETFRFHHDIAVRAALMLKL